MEASKNFTLLIHQLRCSSSRSDHSETQMRKNERPVGAGTRIDLFPIDKRSNGPGLTFLSSCQSSFFEAISSRFDGDRFQMTRHIFFSSAAALRLTSDLFLFVEPIFSPTVLLGSVFFDAGTKTASTAFQLRNDNFSFLAHDEFGRFNKTYKILISKYVLSTLANKK